MGKKVGPLFLMVTIGAALLIIFSLKDPVSRRIVQKRIPGLHAGLEANIEKIQFFEKNPGKMEWELSADRVQILEKGTLTILKNLRLILVSDDRKSIEVKARKGELENSSKNISISEGVEITSDNGYVLQTEKLLWNVDKQEISSKTAVQLRGPNVVLFGDEMRGFLRPQIFELKRVKAVFDLD